MFNVFDLELPTGALREYLGVLHCGPMLRGGTNLDELCPSIGYAATRILAVWYAGQKLYVPMQVRHEHPLRVLLGTAAFRALVRDWGGQHVRVPTLSEDQRLIRDRRIAEMAATGLSDAGIARVLEDVSPERVGQVRRALTANGLIDAEIFETGRGF